MAACPSIIAAAMKIVRSDHKGRLWSLLGFPLQGPRPVGRDIHGSLLRGAKGPEGPLVLVSAEPDHASVPNDIQHISTLLAPTARQSTMPRMGTSCSPETFLVEGSPLRAFVLPVLWIADLKEAWHICGLRSGNTYFPDINYMVPRNELTEATKTYPRRDVDTTRKVRRAW